MNAGVDRYWETEVRVRYAETDQMGVAYHSNFVIWFEVGRVEALRQLGFCYKEMEQQDDCHIAVVEVKCRYKLPARYDDLLTIRTRLQNVRSSFLHFGYEVFCGGELLAEGDTVHIVVNSKFEKTSLPAKYLKAFRSAIEN